MKIRKIVLSMLLVLVVFFSIGRTAVTVCADTSTASSDEYINVWDKIDQTSITGDEGVKESNGLVKALDGNNTTKWCVAITQEDHEKNLQWAMTEPITLKAYAFVTANDMENKDPKEWKLYGSNDPNGEWTVLSHVTDGQLPIERSVASENFVIDAPGEYKYYKLTVIDNNGHLEFRPTKSHHQFSELILFAEDTGNDGDTGDDEAIKMRSEFIYETDDTELRILLTSDVHHTYLREWYGTSSEDRLQLWVDSIKKEHAENPFDLILLVGDYSLDHWIAGGSVLKDGISTTESFIRDYVSQLPDDVPVFILPGNHEQYSEEKWYEMTGNYRSGTVLLGNNLFIMADTYDSNLDPTVHSDGTYTPIDVEWIKSVMDKYPGTNVYIVAHSIETTESEEFQTLLASEERIIGMFKGHTHKDEIVYRPLKWGYKTIAQTGHFSHTDDAESESFWGFRELVITADAAYSQYIRVESDAVVDGNNVHFDRLTQDAILYYGDAPEGVPVAGIKTYDGYINLNDKIDQSNITGDAGVNSDEDLNMIFDNLYLSKYCVETIIGEDGSRTIQWAMTEPQVIDAYAFVTGGDMKERDPWAWKFYGTNDPDGGWTELSSVDEGNLPNERCCSSDAFVIDNPDEYQYYKLVITDNRGHRSAKRYRHYQLSELILLQAEESGSGDSGETGSGDGAEEDGVDSGNNVEDATQDSLIASPKTGDSNIYIVWYIIAIIVTSGVIVFLLGKKTHSRI